MRRFREKSSSYVRCYCKNNKKQACDILIARYMLRIALETGVGWEELFCDSSGASTYDKHSSFLDLPVILRDDRDLEKEIKQCEKENLEYLIKPTIKELRTVLIKKLEEFEKLNINESDSPIFKNVNYLGDKLKLNKVEREILILIIFMKTSYELTEYVRKISRSLMFNKYDYCKLLSNILNCKASTAEVNKALSENSPLLSLGFLEWNSRLRDLEDMIDIIDELPDILFCEYENQEDIINWFGEFENKATLNLDNFEHVQKDANILIEYLSSALKMTQKGVNILIYGKAGTGKTEFARTLAKQVKAKLCTITYKDNKGEALDEKSRLAALKTTQKFFSASRDIIILFDESEDVLKNKLSFFSMFTDSDMNFDNNKGNKGFINNTLEENEVPTIWVMNSIDGIHKAHLRRFQYILPFPLPSRQIRLNIVKRYFDSKNLSEDFINYLADIEELTPAQIEQLSNFAETLRHLEREKLEEACLHQLKQCSKVLGVKCINRAGPDTVYSFKYLNLDTDVDKLVEGLKNVKSATLCFYGAPGTGKSELARQIAKILNKPFINKKASDLLNPYFGMTEKYIAQMFAEAESVGGLLCLDEADSFLRDRQNSRYTWEITQVNEFLTQMESFNGIFICTTNLVDLLDKASLRRFDFKINFKCLTKDMRLDLFMAELHRMSNKVTKLTAEVKLALSKMDTLTPGDFAAVARKFKVMAKIPSQLELLKALQEEILVKDNNKVKMGF